jgi:transcriptional regulator with XRE-family HTH domain
MTPKQIRARRISAEIPAVMLSAEAKIQRSRYSAIENGHIQPSPDELERLASSLDRLIQAKSVIEQAAASVNWPGALVA